MKYDSHKFLLQPDSQLMRNHCCYCSFFFSVTAQKMKRAQVRVTSHVVFFSKPKFWFLKFWFFLCSFLPHTLQNDTQNQNLENQNFPKNKSSSHFLANLRRSFGWTQLFMQLTNHTACFRTSFYMI